MRATLIFHPGGGSAESDEIEAARAHLEKAFELDARVVKEGDNPAELARSALAEGSELLIACGGDGTVSAVASALIGDRKATLGILPRGTANSIAGHFGIPSSLEEACNVLTRGRAHTLDTALVNGRSMLLMATVGVHAEAITGADPALKRKYGVLAYVFKEIAEMTSDSLFDAELQVDGKRFTCEASAITVANLAPPTTLVAQGTEALIEDDGLLDVTIIALNGFNEALATSLHLASCAFSGRAADRDNIASFRAREVTITSRISKRVMVDGEARGETPLHIRCVPRSLRLMVPASYAEESARS